MEQASTAHKESSDIGPRLAWSRVIPLVLIVAVIAAILIMLGVSLGIHTAVLGVLNTPAEELKIWHILLLALILRRKTVINNITRSRS